MKKYILSFLLISGMLFLCFPEEKASQGITFATVITFSPFGYYENQTIRGFDKDLVALIAREIKIPIFLEDIPSFGFFESVDNRFFDGAISSIRATQERKKRFDFSAIYHHDNLAILSSQDNPIKELSDLHNNTIAYKVGSTSGKSFKKLFPQTQALLFNTDQQLLEALKSGLVDGVLMNESQGLFLIKTYTNLTCTPLAPAEAGCGILFKKGSPLKDKVDKALQCLQETGELQQLKDKWLKGSYE